MDTNITGEAIHIIMIVVIIVINVVFSVIELLCTVSKNILSIIYAPPLIVFISKCILAIKYRDSHISMTVSIFEVSLYV